MKQACEIRTYGDDRFHYTAGYFPDNKWLDNDTLILERAVHPSIGCNDFEGKAGEIELVRLDLRDDRMEVVCRDRIFGYHYLVHGNRIYYTDRQALHVLDLATGANTILYRNEDYLTQGNRLPPCAVPPSPWTARPSVSMSSEPTSLPGPLCWTPPPGGSATASTRPTPAPSLRPPM